MSVCIIKNLRWLKEQIKRVDIYMIYIYIYILYIIYIIIYIIYIYTCIYICIVLSIYLSIYLYIYMYIYREREMQINKITNTMKFAQKTNENKLN